MGDNNFQQMFQEQASHDYHRRASSMMDPRQQHCMESVAAMQRYQNPVTSWPQAQAQHTNLEAMSMLQQAQNNHGFPMMLQSNGQRFYQPSMKMFHQALQQTQGPQLYHATIACSKRFSEEEKQKLEKVFTDETQKPSTSRKRQLAEELGCPVPKVNNWFQNRRAREKQVHRVQAYEASQAADSAASETDVVDAQEDDNEQATSSEFYSLSNRSQPMQPSSAPFSGAADLPEQHLPSPTSTRGQESEDCTTDSSAASPAAVYSASPADGHNRASVTDSHAVISQPQQLPPNQIDTFSGTNVPMIAATFEDSNGDFSSSPDAYTDAQDQMSFQSLNGQFAPDFSTTEMHGLPIFSSDVERSDSFTSSASILTPSTATFSTGMTSHDHAGDQSGIGESDFSSIETLSPDMNSGASPSVEQSDSTADTAFTHPSIASRRKTRPPQRLNQTALRNYPNGPKTGIEGSKRSDMYGSMRRAASANGPLSGKIFKSAPPVSPLSPRSFDPNFLEQFARNSSLAVASNTFKDVPEGSPVGSTFETQYLSADAPRFSFQRTSVSMSSLRETAAASPSTPDFMRDGAFTGVQKQGFQSFHHPTFALDTGYGNTSSSDEALATPSLSQFGSEIEFPTSLCAPRYVESEPATPAAIQSQAFPAFKFDSPPRGEVYPWSRSPDQIPMWKGSIAQLSEPHSHNFQFQPNITPQNFQSPGQG
ncbi:hypothetical protein KVR01_005690 [Diaporthe batatas]|uniref:uncharacterized protein n=1 Tax=Diaporthe batatas TaxID=748121 RepID=UPI001D0589EC|nr:uncharacterized protein KVR01_005690 [Diaporthe batatas]KAG8165415.1 hypothetical protein KVR01_005690 [Diaporthe batatas]